MGALGFLAPLVNGITTNSVIGAVVNGLLWVVIVVGLWLAVEGARAVARRVRQRA
jgi:hypothetical protein